MRCRSPRAAWIKLELLDGAVRLQDLKLPGLDLEKLKGDRKGQHSIRINDQYRICFEWTENGAERTLKSPITTEKRKGDKRHMPRKLSPIHPGEVLKSVLKDAALNANRLALELHVPANRISDILRGKRPITADTALRLARFFGVSAQMWINLQSKYDLQMAEDRLAEKVAEEVRPFKAA